MKKYVYLFKQGCADGNASMANVLGGKGANLAEMSSLNIPVPPGFTISVDACLYFIKYGKYPRGLKTQVCNALKKIGAEMNQEFGSAENPLLVSVRSGAKISMPGMMETVLNVGLNDKNIKGLIQNTQNVKFAYDSYRRLIVMFADVVMEKSNDFNYQIRVRLEKLLRQNNMLDNKKICALFKKNIVKTFNKKFPDNPEEQLWDSISAVFKSWNGTRAKEYRKIENIPDSLGTAVNVQAMVFGNMGKNSATGVAFTRNPSTGEDVFFGEWLPNAQGEDVVAGIRTPYPINNSKNKKNLKFAMQSIYKELYATQNILENHYLDMQDIEFTIQKNKLWLLQTRTGKRNGPAAIKIALDFHKKRKISDHECLNRINANQINELLHPTLSENDLKLPAITKGLPAGPGAAVGQIVFHPDKAKKLYESGLSVILVREETSPEDIHGMFASSAILTSRGGMTSHAALVARGWGKCCIVGCDDIIINEKQKTCIINKKQYKELDWLTLNGSTGYVYDRKLTLTKPELYKSQSFIDLMKICNKNKILQIRANAESAHDTQIAKKMGAKGIGLCRTEHMFFNPKRIHEVRKMILANNNQQKKQAIKSLLLFQTKDFYKILKQMSPYPVTIRLLDPPLHEFLPTQKKQVQKIAKDLNEKVSTIKEKIDAMREVNPMLGHRGCRLGITQPKITEMQATAILSSAHKLKKENIKCVPEIMIPLVGSIKEFLHQKKIILSVAKTLEKKHDSKVYYTIGTMIELPRACLIADKIAEHADFISFGTNDLTQTTFGFSRDDIVSFLPEYLNQSIIIKDPFESLDISGVGELIKIAIKKIKKVNPAMKMGICGEHGGDPDSILFFNKMNFDYISCSPYRIPVAYLSAAKASF